MEERDGEWEREKKTGETEKRERESERTEEREKTII